MRAVPTPALNVHCQHNVGTKRANEPHIIAYNVLAAPLLNYFLRIERIAIIDSPCEILLSAIDPMRR